MSQRTHGLRAQAARRRALGRGERGTPGRGPPGVRCSVKREARTRDLRATRPQWGGTPPPQETSKPGDVRAARHPGDEASRPRDIRAARRRIRETSGRRGVGSARHPGGEHVRAASTSERRARPSGEHVRAASTSGRRHVRAGRPLNDVEPIKKEARQAERRRACSPMSNNGAKQTAGSRAAQSHGGHRPAQVVGSGTEAAARMSRLKKNPPEDIGPSAARDDRRHSGARSAETAVGRDPGSGSRPTVGGALRQARRRTT